MCIRDSITSAFLRPPNRRSSRNKCLTFLSVIRAKHPVKRETQATMLAFFQPDYRNDEFNSANTARCLLHHASECSHCLLCYFELREATLDARKETPPTYPEEILKSNSNADAEKAYAFVCVLSSQGDLACARDSSHSRLHCVRCSLRGTTGECSEEAGQVEKQIFGDSL